MPWGRCDDTFYRHEKVLQLPEEHRKGALSLFWLAISWCNDQLTDGLVPTGAIRILGGDIEEAEALVEVGLWEKDGRHFRVHDFLVFNKSKEQVERERAQRALAGAAGAARRWHPDSEVPYEPASDLPYESASEMRGGVDGKAMPPYPVPRTPVTYTPEPFAREVLPHIDATIQEQLERITGRSLLQAGARQLSELDRLVEDHGPTDVCEALEAVSMGKRMTARQVVWAAMKYLEPIPKVKAPEPEPEHKHVFYGYPTARCACGLTRNAA